MLRASRRFRDEAGLKLILCPRILVIVQLIALLAGCNRTNYELIERTEKLVPDFQGTGTHTQVNYVLAHDGQKIHATCDWKNFSNSDPDATCGFRMLRNYECTSGFEGGTEHMWDLKCKDSNGHNVYLFVDKKE